MAISNSLVSVISKLKLVAVHYCPDPTIHLLLLEMVIHFELICNGLNALWTMDRGRDRLLEAVG